MKKTVNFLSDQDYTEFKKENRFIDRTIRISESSTDDSEIEILNFLNSKYRAFLQQNSNNFQCTWIDGLDGDGISWVTEKIRSNFKKCYNNHNSNLPNVTFYSLSNHNLCDNYPKIAELIDKSTFLKCGYQSKLMPSKFRIIKAISIIFILFYPILFAIYNLFGKQTFFKNNETWNDLFTFNNSTSVLTPIIFIVIGTVLQYLSNFFIKDDKSRYIINFLETIKDSKNHNSVEYENFKTKVASRINFLPSPRIIFVDDFSKLDPITQEIIIEYFNSNKTFIGKDFWIVLDTSIRCQTFIKPELLEDNYLFPKLLPLNINEKEKLVKLLNLPNENICRETLKSICSPEGNEEAQNQIYNELFKYIHNHLSNHEIYSIIDFLYLIALNSYPNQIEFYPDYLTDRITAKSVIRDMYIQKILKGTELLRKELRYNFKMLFENNLLQKYLIITNKKSNLFKVRNEIRSVFEKNYQSLGLVDTRLCHGYWSLFWYNRIQNHKLEIPWIKKLSYHLINSTPLNGNLDTLNSLLNAHLFCINKSVNLCLKNETRELIINSLSLIDKYKEVDRKIKVSLCQLINYATFNFYFKSIKDFIEPLDNFNNTEIYDLINNHAAKDLHLIEFMNDDAYFIELTYHWIRIIQIFLSIEYFPNAIFEEFLEIQIKFAKQQKKESYDSLRLEKKNIVSELKIRNIAIAIWTQTLSLYIQGYNDRKGLLKLMELVDELKNQITGFIEFLSKDSNEKVNLDNFNLIATKKESGLILVASLLLIFKKFESQKKIFKQSEIERFTIENLEKLKGIYTLNIRIPDELDSDSIIYNLTSLMSFQSIFWKKLNLNYRYIQLTLIKIQFYTFCSNLRNVNESFKLEIEDILSDDTVLSSLANITLSLHYKQYAMGISSFYFQNSLSHIFHKNTISSPRDLENVIQILLDYNDSDTYLLKSLEIIYAVIQKSNNETLRNIFKSDNISNHYLEFTNCLKRAENNISIGYIKWLEENLTNITNTKEQELAQSYLINFKFARLIDQNKVGTSEIENYKTYWLNKKSIKPFSTALIHLKRINILDETLIPNVNQLLLNNERSSYSGFIMLAEEICSSYDEYTDTIENPLRFIKQNIENWNSILSPYSILKMYQTLNRLDIPKGQYHSEVSITEKKIIALEYQNNIAYVINGNFFMLYYQTFMNWENKGLKKNGIRFSEFKLKINFDPDTKLELLEKEFIPHSHLPKPINGNEINLDFLLWGNILFSTKVIEKTEFNLFRKKVNSLSEKYLLQLIDIITDLPDIDNSVSEMLKLYYSKLMEYNMPEEKDEIELIDPNKGYI